MRFAHVLLASALVLGGCTTITDPATGALGAPTGLTYALLPSGDPTHPDGILLRWEDANDDRVADYVIYSRASTADAWSRRASTTSNTFHDAGVPHLQYYVVSEDDAGNESQGSNVVTVDERNRLPAPTTVTSVSLDKAIQLSWSSTARTGPGGATLFSEYRVYSTGYDLDAGSCVQANWVLEGSTVSEDFLATGLPNGAPRCFTISTISTDGHESVWTTPRYDTPRYDARNVIIDAFEDVPATSGFRFFSAPQNFGLILAGSRTDIDFRVERHADGSLWLRPIRAGTRIALYANTPVTDLTSIDVAPARTAFGTGAIEAVPGYAYVFETQDADGLHYGAVRVTHVGQHYLILDWAYQTDPGNPELARVRRTQSLPPI